MSAMAPARPAENEYAPYYGKYVALVTGGDIVETLARQNEDTLALLGGITEERAAFRYEPGKWSIKQVVGHLIDAERIFAYRALSIARGERKPLPGMEQDEYMATTNFDSRTLAELAEEFSHVRVASDNEVTVRAIAYIIAGHEAHHVKILRERYL